MDVSLAGGTAYVHGDVCGVGAHADGSAHAQVSFNAGVKMDAKGTYDAANKCVNLDISGTTLTISSFSIHDPSVSINLDGINFNVGSLVSLIQDLDPDIDNLIKTEIQNEVVPIVTKLVNGLGCVKIPISKQEDTHV